MRVALVKKHGKLVHVTGVKTELQVGQERWWWEDIQIFFHLVLFSQVFSEEWGQGMFPIILPTLPLTKLPPLYHHPNPPLCPLELLIHSQQALPLPVIQCFLSAYTSPSTLGSTLLGLGDCKHIFAGPLLAGFLLPTEDSGEQRWEGESSFSLLALMV